MTPRWHTYNVLSKMKELPISMSPETRDSLLEALEVLSKDPDEVKPVLETGWTWDLVESNKRPEPDYSKSELLLLGYPNSHTREQWMTKLLGYPVQVRPAIRRLIEGRQLESKLTDNPKRGKSIRFTLIPPPNEDAWKRASTDWNE
ncbi:MAG: hypothetical protein AAF514_21970 [Verrucomicrobiota bacterium]